MSGTGLAEHAPAKINLFLHVGPPRGDGFHPLLSHVVFTELGDTLRLSPGMPGALRLSGPMADALSGANLVEAAAQALATEAGRSPAGRLELEKHVPVAAGMGGGSADAAACLRLLSRHWGLDAEIARSLAPSLGADVPVCLASRAQRMGGIGEELAPAASPDAWLVLVNPGVPTPTGAVFRAYDDTDPRRDLEPASWPDAAQRMDAKDLCDWLAETRNDLQAPAFALVPQARAAHEAVSTAPGVLCARMTGSGATIFGVCSDIEAAEGAAKWLTARHPDWWVQATRIQDLDHASRLVGAV